MQNWKVNILWAAYPLAALMLTFGLIGAVNWAYESKLLTDRPPLLAMAVGMAVLAGFLLVLIRIFWSKAQSNWFLVPLTLITIFLIFPGLFIVILGPAAITMSEQANGENR